MSFRLCIQTFPDGHKLPYDSIEDDSEHKITIQGITKFDKGRKIICSANQFFEDLQATDSEDHEITIDVWCKNLFRVRAKIYLDAPEFDQPDISQYAIKDRPVLLWCNVSDANPAPTSYRFFMANKELKDGRNYEINVDEDEMHATLLVSGDGKK